MFQEIALLDPPSITQRNQLQKANKAIYQIETFFHIQGLFQ